MQIRLQSGKLVKSDHPLSQFVACLREDTLKERIKDAKRNLVIELPKGFVWLGDQENFSNQLFMRPCYFDLLDAKKEYFNRNSKLRAVVYTGTPGIGKSHMCAFVVAQELIAGTVVFFKRAVKSDKDVEERAVYRLHLESGVHRFQSSGVLDFVSCKDNTMYIVDGLFARFPTARVDIQIFASPSQALYRPVRKSWPGYLYLHTPLVDLVELQSMRSAVSTFQTLTEEDVVEWFMAAGGVARTVLLRASLGNSVQGWKADAHTLIFNMKKEDIEKVVIGI